MGAAEFLALPEACFSPVSTSLGITPGGGTFFPLILQRGGDPKQLLCPANPGSLKTIPKQTSNYPGMESKTRSRRSSRRGGLLQGVQGSGRNRRAAGGRPAAPSHFPRGGIQSGSYARLTRAPGKQGEKGPLPYTGRGPKIAPWQSSEDLLLDWSSFW